MPVLDLHLSAEIFSEDIIGWGVGLETCLEVFVSQFADVEFLSQLDVVFA